jgi:hypothetical protein
MLTVGSGPVKERYKLLWRSADRTQVKIHPFLCPSPQIPSVLRFSFSKSALTHSSHEADLSGLFRQYCPVQYSLSPSSQVVLARKIALDISLDPVICPRASITLALRHSWVPGHLKWRKSSCLRGLRPSGSRCCPALT